MAGNINDAWASLRRRDAPTQKTDDEPERDILAEHFGDDWRTSFESRPADPDPDPSEGAEPDDPYAVLGVASTATWNDIIEAHRALARQNHPDRQYGRTDVEAAAAEERIRDVNVAYQKLRIRRGR